MADLLTDEQVGIKPQKRVLSDAEMGIRAPAPTVRPMTLQERSNQVYGFDPLKERGTLLPVGKTKEGKFTFAVPQVLKDLAESALLPGHVMQGGTYTAQDATRFALDFLTPTDVPAPASVVRKSTLSRAPSTDTLKQAAGVSKEAAKSSGVVINQTGQKKFLQGIANIAEDEAVTPGLHDKIVRVVGRIVNRAAKEQDVTEIIRQRQLLQDVAQAGSPAEQRIARKMIDTLDEFINNLSPSDLVKGEAQNVGKNLQTFRSLWTRAKKSQQIEGIIQTAQSQASGFENGLRIGFRRILKDPKLSKGWTNDELKMMQQIVEGTSKTKMLRLIGKLSFGTRGGSNWLGGTAGSTIGGTVGYAVGGPVGAAVGTVTPPMVGYAAQKGVDAAQANTATMLRQLAASGGLLPKPYTQKQLANMLLRYGARAGAARVEETAGATYVLPPGTVVPNPNVL